MLGRALSPERGPFPSGICHRMPGQKLLAHNRTVKLFRVAKIIKSIHTIFAVIIVAPSGAKKRIEMQTDQQKILAALAEKPLTTFNIMKRVNIKSQDECQTLLLKMRDEGAVKFDIHKGVWNI